MIFPQHYVTICARSLFTSNYTTSMQNTSLNITEQHCTTLHCTALQCIVLHCIALQCTAMPCTALHCTALNCIAPMRGSSSTRLTADGNNYKFPPGILDSHGGFLSDLWGFLPWGVLVGFLPVSQKVWCLIKSLIELTTST